MVIPLFDEVNQLRIAELEEQITQARNAYYNGTPSVEDRIYDAWVDELADLKSDSPAVTAVGAPAVSAWPKVAHSIPMGSLDKVQTLDEMTVWVQKVARKERKIEELLVTEKLDGISVSLRYEGGKFVQALTRGDGQEGEDITPNVARMKGLLQELPEETSVVCRGEIVLLKEDHQAHFPETANPRNTASGTSKRLDGRGCEHLTVIVYQALEGPEFLKEDEQFEWLVKMGFQVPRWYTSAMAIGSKTPHDLWVDYQQTIREQLPYEIDGLVVRLNDLAYQWSLGDKNGRPLGAVAFKFAPIARETVATGRIDQVGGTGRITPVAVFKPIRILGAEISRASLYNQKYIEQIGFDVGARILVSRANDVIPRVVSVTASLGTTSKPPATCPECGAETMRDGEYIICPNTGLCPAQTEGRIKQWIRELGILEWGPTLIQKVVGEKLVASVPDLYRLRVDQLAELERMGPSSAKNGIDQLWKVVPLSLEQLLGSLSIPLCATSTMQTVVDAGYDSFEKIRAATKDQLQNIPGMGPKRAEALALWVTRNGAVVDELASVGVKVKERTKGVLTGKSVCFTGKSNLKRGELERLVLDAGGTVKKSVGKGLTYLVMADLDSGSTKAQAAKKNGVECLTEDTFVQMVQG